MNELPKFYFPLAFLRVPSGTEEIERPPFRLCRRKWSTSTFDLATLAARHKLHLPFQIMDVLLERCYVELEVEAASLDGAMRLVSQIRFALYLGGATPFIVPFATTHSINEYSGINYRDSASLVEKLPVEQRQGITSSTAQVEAWPIELTFTCFLLPESAEVSEWQFQQAASRALKWQALEAAKSELGAFREAAEASPMLASESQSFLHLWCGLEALFPKVSTEVSFRLSLYLAQLMPGANRLEMFKRYRKSYDLRSRIAHGALDALEYPQWKEGWALLTQAGEAIIQRGQLPSEDELLQELLRPSDAS